MELLIETSGNIRCVYGEEIALSRLGVIQIHRGSHVEPTSDGQWTADLSPVKGPVLGPFVNRTAALAAEIDWLRRHWLLPEVRLPSRSLRLVQFYCGK